MNQSQSLIKRCSALFIGGIVLATVGTVSAGVGTQIWQKTYVPTSSFHQGFFYDVGFYPDGSILAAGFRSEADSGSAIGIHYNAEDGSVLMDAGQTEPEWFKFESSYSDYTHDRFYGLHIDSSGNTFFAGRGYPAGWNSFSTRHNIPNLWKYDNTYTNSGAPGRPAWRSYHTDGNVANGGWFTDMTVDSSGAIYAVGHQQNHVSTASNYDWLIYKYDNAGNVLTNFPLTFNTDNLADYANGVATDSEDNFIVVGSSVIDAATDHHNWVVRKYASDGTLLWEDALDFMGLNDIAQAVVVDSEDNIIVCGYRTNDADEDEADWLIVKYAKDGDGAGGATTLWEQSWDDGANTVGVADGLLLDSSNNVYIIGRQFNDIGRYRSVLQYRNGQTGALLKSQNIVLDATPNNSPGTEHDYLKRLALNDGKLVIVGYTQQDGSYSLNYRQTGRIITLKLFPKQDVNGDGKVALDDTISILQLLANDPDGGGYLGLEDPISILQVLTNDPGR